MSVCGEPRSGVCCDGTELAVDVRAHVVPEKGQAG